MNKLIEIAKEITRLWHEQDREAYTTLKKSGYTSQDIRIVVSIMKEANSNMVESEQKEIEGKNKWID